VTCARSGGSRAGNEGYSGIGVVVWSEDPHDDFGPVVDNYVHHNDIIMSVHGHPHNWSLAWMEYQWSNGMGDSRSNNRGEANRYFYLNAGNSIWPFAYVNQWFSHSDLSGFNQTRGENNGTYLSQSDKDQVLANVGVPSAPESRSMRYTVGAAAKFG
jgi:hypothetical protein